MAIAPVTEVEPAAPFQNDDDSIRPFVWTRPLLRQLVDAGVIHEGDRVELIEGDLVVMPVQKGPHAVASALVEETLRLVFGAGYHVRGQKPVALGDRSEPEPDIAVVRGRIRDYLADHPTPDAIALLVEVSDTTLRYDRQRKMSLYARYAVREAWIVNLQERVLEVYRDPAPDPTAEHGYSYRSRAVIPADGLIAPSAAPDKPVNVADLLP
jgi:Uma2 family endonuclease